jgi:hypothetical protein
MNRQQLTSISGKQHTENTRGEGKEEVAMTTAFVHGASKNKMPGTRPGMMSLN